MAGGKPTSSLEVKRKPPKPPVVYINILKRWTPSLMGFGVFSGSMFLYFTDWQIFMDKVPFYNKKFVEKEPIV